MVNVVAVPPAIGRAPIATPAYSAAYSMRLVAAPLVLAAVGIAATGPPPQPAASEPKAVGWWAFDSPAGAVGAHLLVADRAGGPPASVDSGGSLLPLGVDGVQALRLYGNTTATLTVPHHPKIDGVQEFTISLWVNWWWGGSSLVAKENGFELLVYRQFLKTAVSNTNGSVEWTPYPLGCAYVQPAKWIHIALSYTSDGRLHLFMHGEECTSTNAFWQEMAAISSKSGPDYTTPVGPFAPKTGNITIGGWSGLVSDVRLFDGRLDAAALQKLHASTAHVYNRTVHQAPSEAEIEAQNRTWKPPKIGPAQLSMYDAWLNHNLSGTTQSSATPPWLERVALVTSASSHPALRTAVAEVQAALPGLPAARHAVPSAATTATPTLAKLVGRSVVLGICADLAAVLALLRPDSTARRHCDSLAESPNEDAYALELVTAAQTGKHGEMGEPFIVAVGGGVPGLLYAAYAVVEHMQLNKRWSVAAVARAETPTTQIRCINEWSQWRGLPWGRWLGEAGRGGSIFSWADLQAGLTEGPAGPSTKRIRDWARLLSAVGINAIAPQDVNWAEENNYLKHLDVLPVLGDVLRAYAIRLYWTPNYLLAAEQSTADALFNAVPDLGGYLLKIGSEKQGGVPNVDTINPIAQTLLRPAGSGQRNGSVLLRGFIYGSKGVISSGFNYTKQSRFAIPPSVFGPGDGKYLHNVHIMGKYSPLDFETQEPINPLDGLLKHTKYGPEYVVGKDGFMMSWVSRWTDWLNFDNHR